MTALLGIKKSPPSRLGVRVAVAAACFWTLDLLLLRAGTPHPLDDTWEYGLAAASLLEGHGFRTAMIHPPLWSLRDSALTVPVLVHGPLVPLLVAPLLAAFGRASLDQVAWLAAAFMTLAAVCGARVAYRAAGGGAAALVAGIVTCSPIAVRTVHHDVSPAVGAGLAALALDLVARRDPRPFAAGLALGFGVLARPELLGAAALAALAVGALRAPLLAVGFLIPALPWWWRTGAITGMPLFGLSSYLLVGHTARYPELSSLRDFGLPPARWPETLAGALPTLPAKWLTYAPHAIKRVLVAPSEGTGWLSAIGALAALRTREWRRGAVLALAAAAIPFALCTATESSERYVAVFLPLWALAAAVGGETLRARLVPGVRSSAAAFLVAALLVPSTLGTLVAEAGRSAALRTWLAAERKALVTRSAPGLEGRLLYSDTPDFAAWTTGRPALWLTADEYARLPAAESSTSGAAADRPARGTPLDEWFHADVRAIPAPTGGSAAELSTTR